MCNHLYIVWSHMPPYITVQYVPQPPVQVCWCVSPISCAAISCHSDRTGKSPSRELQRPRYGKHREPCKSCQRLPEDNFSRCLCFPLHWGVSACVSGRVCVSVSISWTCKSGSQLPGEKPPSNRGFPWTNNQPCPSLLPPSSWWRWEEHRENIRA